MLILNTATLPVVLAAASGSPAVLYINSSGDVSPVVLAENNFVLGNSSKVPTAKTPTQVTAVLDTFVQSGSSHKKGLVPDPGSIAGNTAFLCENGTWVELTNDGTLLFSSVDPDSRTNSTSELTFDQSYNIPAGSLRVGDVIRLKASGVWFTSSTPGLTLQMRLKLNSNTVLNTTAMAVPIDVQGSWTLDAILTVFATGATSTIEAQGTAAFDNNLDHSDLIHYVLGNGTTYSVDLDVDELLAVSIQWSAASTSNVVHLREFVVEKLRPYPRRNDGVQWVDVLNDSGDTIPARSLVRVTGVEDETYALIVDVPDQNSDVTLFVTDEYDIEDGAYGKATEEQGPIRIRFNDGFDPPETGELWGSYPNDLRLNPGRGGYVIRGGIDEDDSTVLASRYPCCSGGSGDAGGGDGPIQSLCCPEGELIDNSDPLTLTMVSTGTDPDWFVASITLDPVSGGDLQWDKTQDGWRYYVQCSTQNPPDGNLILTIQSTQGGSPCSFSFGGVVVSCDPLQLEWDYGSESECNSPVNDPYDFPDITGTQ